MNRPSPTPEPRVRLDKWLWAARLYKTRALAADEVEHGRVLANGAPCKPARELRVGDRLTLRQGPVLRELVVRQLSVQRGPASVAQQLYEETPESLVREAARREQLRLAPDPALGHTDGRPTKRDRRDIERAWDQRWSASAD